MCPPPNSPPLSEIQCNNEQIALFLNNYSEQSILPRNVMVDLNPYLQVPSKLQEGQWYLVRPCGDKECIDGIWKIKEAPREIYSNDVITGWKIVLEYFPEEAPNDEETNNWLMEEYSITSKNFLDEDKTKDVRILCRVFQGSEVGPRIVPNAETDAGLDDFDFLAANIPDFDFPPAPDALNENMGNLEAELRAMVEMDDNKNSPDLNGIPRDDYIEMNDLRDPISPGSLSFSSHNSSCTTLSDQYLDIVDFLGENKEDKKKKKQLNSKGAAPAPAPAEVNDAPPELETTRDANDVPDTCTVTSPQTGTTEVAVVAAAKTNAAKRGSTDGDTATTSSGSADRTSRGKKTSLSKVRKLKPYFCFFF